MVDTMWGQISAFVVIGIAGVVACGDSVGGTGGLTGLTTVSTSAANSTGVSSTNGAAATNDPAGSETASMSGTSATTGVSTTDPTTGTGHGSGVVTTDETSDPSESGSTTGPFQAEPCQIGTTFTEPKPSNVMFVLDKSGSMSMEEWDHDEDLLTPPVTRWKSLYDVVEFIVTEFDSSINFGAKLFPKYDAGSYIAVGACVVDEGIEVPVGPMNAANVLAGIPGPDFEVLGGTPIYTGLTDTYSYLKGLNAAIPRAVVLVADGEISCDEDVLATVFAVSDAWMEDDIATYVVGIDAGPAASSQLSKYAEKGGKPNLDDPEVDFYPTKNQDDLYDAIQKIVTDTVSCVVPVDPVPDQPEIFEVWIDGALVPLVDDCEDDDGWVWVKDDYSALELCGTACLGFKSTGALEAKYWCTPE